MELLYAMTLGVLTTCGVYLLLRARTFTVILGLTLLSQAMRLAIDILETKRTQQIQPTESQRTPVQPVTSTRDQPVKPDVNPASRAPRGGSGRRRRRSGRGRRRH